MTEQKIVIIGAGQAGLALGHELALRKLAFTILDAGPAVGHSWRDRWDSLTIFTPAKYSALPGRALDVPANHAPSKNEVAAYLEGYARQFALPVRSGVRVTHVSRANDGYLLETSEGSIEADIVVVATGPNTVPHIPTAAAALDPSIVQVHSGDYRNPSSMPEGDVLVVGAGTSGTQLALELSASHHVTIAGRPTPTIPPRVSRLLGAVQWRVINNLLTRSTPMGRKAAARFFDHGAPLIRIGVPDLVKAGVHRVGRFTGVRDGMPVVADAGVLQPTSIIWATGYRPDFGWIDDLTLDGAGWPQTERGVVPGDPGLYFVGMPFQYAISSGLLGGVGRDAAYVAARIVEQQDNSRSAGVSVQEAH